MWSPMAALRHHVGNGRMRAGRIKPPRPTLGGEKKKLGLSAGQIAAHLVRLPVNERLRRVDTLAAQQVLTDCRLDQNREIAPGKYGDGYLGNVHLEHPAQTA